MESKIAVVTGATGMLAIALINRLVKEGYHVYAVVRPNTARIKNVPSSEKVTVVECDLTDIQELPELINERCDAFYHFAWDSTYGSARNDMMAQVKNIQAAIGAVFSAEKLGCKVFLGAGSQAEYGRCEHTISPSTPTFPENGYGMAKLCAAQMTRVMCKQRGIKHIWCRIFSTYGPYDGDQTMVASGIIKMLRKERPQYTKGEQQWDYLYCDDAAKAFYLAAEKGKDGSIYCVGSGKTRQLKDYILAIRDAIDPELEVGIGEIPYFENQVMYLCADISDLTKDTGYYPEYSFEEGIKATVEYFKSRGC